MEPKDKIDVTCHHCDSFQFCTVGRKNKKRQACPFNSAPEVLAAAKEVYENDPETRETTRVASIVEAKGYMQWPRLKDTIEYARMRGYKRIGIAYCIGLLNEARKIAEILGKYGFEVNSVCCKTGSLTKSEIDVPEEYTIRSKTGYIIGWITCNPVAQALLLNRAQTELNLICGLCVGHDITFTQDSKAPVTTLIAKDRALLHNPAAVLFSYYGETFFREDLQKPPQK